MVIAIANGKVAVMINNFNIIIYVKKKAFAQRTNYFDRPITLLEQLP